MRYRYQRGASTLSKSSAANTSCRKSSSPVTSGKETAGIELRATFVCAIQPDLILSQQYASPCTDSNTSPMFAESTTGLFVPGPSRTFICPDTNAHRAIKQPEGRVAEGSVDVMASVAVGMGAAVDMRVAVGAGVGGVVGVVITEALGNHPYSVSSQHSPSCSLEPTTLKRSRANASPTDELSRLNDR